MYKVPSTYILHRYIPRPRAMEQALLTQHENWLETPLSPDGGHNRMHPQLGLTPAVANSR